MHYRRRLICLPIVVLLIISVVCTAFASEYTDVSGLSSDYKNCINWVSDNGVMVGTSNTSFSPEATLSRAMFVTILYSFAGKPTVPSGIVNPFVDVPAGKYYTTPVLWAYSLGLVAGTSSTTFSPNDPVTHIQLYTILRRFASDYRGYSLYTLYPANDDSLAIAEIPFFSYVSSYAKTPVKWAVSNGILKTSSITSGSFYSSNVKRKQAAAYFTRFNTNVDMLVPGESSFSFKNGVHFMSMYSNPSRYYINSAHVNWLCNHLYNTTTPYILNGFSGDYKGSCFGMSLAIILDMTGRIDLNGGYGRNADKMYDLHSPLVFSNLYNYTTTDYYTGEMITTSESALHYLHFIQLDIQNMYSSKGGTIDFTANNAFTKMSSFIQKMRYSGLALYNIEFTSGAKHSVVVMGPPKTNESCPTTYQFSVYDPNKIYDSYPVSLMTIENSSSNTSGVVDSRPWDTIYRVEYITDFSLFDYYDLDGAQNNYPH
ncbi:MAG: S-layer homology domain-containing protein [Oscillospiraceae bacterium]|nr:S-layer homology domain-containing protein [Oscillospiraceae bacterium]